MDFRSFEERAWHFWDRIPDDYKEGIDGLVVSRDALPHPTLPDIYTLGECVTEAYPSDWAGPETMRSVVVLYYGSFWRLSKLDHDLDWEEELWETLTHELQHHLESLAAEDALIDMDYAADESFKRREGEPFDPFYYRSGEEVAERVYRIEREFYLEIAYREGAEPGGWIEFGWHGESFRIRRPNRLGDVCFLAVTGGLDAGPGGLELVLVRRRGLLAGLRSWLGRERPEIVEAEAEAERVERTDA